MNKPKVSDIVGIINKKYPFCLSEEWDNTGLHLGDPDSVVEKVLVALDPLPEVVEQAINKNCQLLVTHHPLIFSPLRQITTATSIGKIVLKAASAGLSILSMHTNYDIASEGLNDILSERIGLKEIKPLKITGHDDLVKLAVFVPDTHFVAVREALFQWAEPLGKYRNCSFAASGEGTFLPLDGACPAVGSVGLLETVSERRLEMLVRKEKLAGAIKKLLSVHPYEEPAFDCYPLLNESVVHGLGRVGCLQQPVAIAEFADTVMTLLGTASSRIVGELSRKVQKIAVCSGGGASLLRDAVRVGADLLLTGDVKYHEAREAEVLGIALLDAGHFPTEQPMVDSVQLFLDSALKQQGLYAEIQVTRIEADPFRTVVAP